MSAQKELADWLADRGKYPPAVWAGAGGLILAEHGPALAELIKAAKEMRHYFDAVVEHRQAGGGVPHALIGRAAEARGRMHESLDKLTDPKA